MSATQRSGGVLIREHSTAAALYSVAWWAVPRLPSRLTAPAFRLGADAAARAGGAAATRWRANLRRVRPAASAAELDTLVRVGMRSYARYWRELFALPGMDAGAVVRAMDPCVAGREHVDAALAAGRGVVLACPHMGNWDVGGLWLAHRYGRFTTLAERLRPESLYRRFVATRAALGIDVLAHSGRATLTALRRRLLRGGIVCLLADRDLTGGGLAVDFFGEPAPLPGGPAALAASTGAALLPAACWFTGRGWAARVHPPLPVRDVRTATQGLATAFAAEIAEHPADWHMPSTIWTADR